MVPAVGRHAGLALHQNPDHGRHRGGERTEVAGGWPAVEPVVRARAGHRIVRTRGDSQVADWESFRFRGWNFTGGIRAAVRRGHRRPVHRVVAGILRQVPRARDARGDRVGAGVLFPDEERDRRRGERRDSHDFAAKARGRDTRHRKRPNLLETKAFSRRGNEEAGGEQEQCGGHERSELRPGEGRHRVEQRRARRVGRRRHHHPGRRQRSYRLRPNAGRVRSAVGARAGHRIPRRHRRGVDRDRSVCLEVAKTTKGEARGAPRRGPTLQRQGHQRLSTYPKLHLAIEIGHSMLIRYANHSAPVAYPTNTTSSLRRRNRSSAVRRPRQSRRSKPNSSRHPLTVSFCQNFRYSDSSLHMRWYLVFALCRISLVSARALTISSASCTMNSASALASDCLLFLRLLFLGKTLYTSAACISVSAAHSPPCSDAVSPV